MSGRRANLNEARRPCALRSIGGVRQHYAMMKDKTMNTIQTCRHAIAMLADEQCMTGWSDAHTAALRLAVQFLANSAAGTEAEDISDAARYRWLRDEEGALNTFTAAYWNTSTPAQLDSAIDDAMTRTVFVLPNVQFTGGRRPSGATAG